MRCDAVTVNTDHRSQDTMYLVVAKMRLTSVQSNDILVSTRSTGVDSTVSPFLRGNQATKQPTGHHKEHVMQLRCSFFPIGVIIVIVLLIAAGIPNVTSAAAFVEYHSSPTLTSALLLSPQYLCCFGVASIASFSACSKPNRPPDFVSPTSSEYWDEGDCLVRHSDHWSGQHGIAFIKESTWTIHGQPDETNEFLTGKCDYREFLFQQKKKKASKKKPNRRR
jgi:hypothetical protein